MVGPSFAVMAAAAAWTLHVYLKPDDHVLQHDLKMIQRASSASMETSGHLYEYNQSQIIKFAYLIVWLAAYK